MGYVNEFHENHEEVIDYFCTELEFSKLTLMGSDQIISKNVRTKYYIFITSNSRIIQAQKSEEFFF